MRLSNYIKLCLIALLPAASAFGQADIHFSQFYETSILRNPSLTGVFADDYKFGIYYRNQWSSITFPYETFLASAETHVPVSHNSYDFFSFGMLGLSDKAGSLSQRISAFYPAVSYNKSLNPDYHSYLSVGFTGGYIQYSFDPSKATFNNQYVGGMYSASNPSLENIANPKMSFWDMGAGVNFNTSFGDAGTSVWIIGVSAYHFSQPGFSYYETPDVDLNMRWNVNSALSFDMSEEVSVQLQGNFALQGTYREIVGGALFNWNVISSGSSTLFGVTFGGLYRLADAVIPVVKFKYQNWGLGVSYDVNTSTLKQASHMQGAYETTLFVSGLYPNNSGVQKKLVCPRF
jgi:type IX secretion system PorP/SprF family membrane protein